MIEFCYWCGKEITTRWGHLERDIQLGNKGAKFIAHVVTDQVLTEPLCKDCLISAIEKSLLNLKEG